MMPVAIVHKARRELASLLFGRDVNSVEDRNYRNLLLSGAWFGPVDGGIFNYLPVFLARLGASPSLVSLLASGPSLLGILCFIPGGAYAERHPDQVKLVVRAAFIARLSYLLIALLPLLLSPPQVALAAIILWSLMAIPNAVHVSAWTGVMQRAVPPSRRAQLNGTRWALMSLFSGSSIALFGLLLDRTPFPAGYQIVFMASFLANLLHLYYFGQVKVPPFVPHRAEGGNGGMADRLRSFWSPFVESRPFIRYNLATLSYRLALAMPAGLFSVFWVQDLHASDTWIGLRGTAGYAALVVGYWYWGRMANRLGHRTLLWICGLAQASYPVLTALAPAPQWLLPAAVVWGFTVSGIDIGFFDLLLATCPEGRQPSFAAAANMLASVAITLGPLLGAGLAQVLGIQSALFAIGGLQAAATAFFVLLPGQEWEAAKAVP